MRVACCAQNPSTDWDPALHIKTLRSGKSMLFIEGAAAAQRTVCFGRSTVAALRGICAAMAVRGARGTRRACCSAHACGLAVGSDDGVRSGWLVGAWRGVCDPMRRLCRFGIEILLHGVCACATRNGDMIAGVAVTCGRTWVQSGRRAERGGRYSGTNPGEWGSEHVFAVADPSLPCAAMCVAFALVYRPEHVCARFAATARDRYVLPADCM
jgi:hypothetical protein